VVQTNRETGGMRKQSTLRSAITGSWATVYLLQVCVLWPNAHLARTHRTVPRTGYLAYLGAFNATYRSEVCQQWDQHCQELHIPCTDKFSIAAVLGDPLQIREWTTNQACRFVVL
jgi:hypothetical protein